ncbi:MAG: hypothetical protein ACI8WB_003437 [Phenylobacterium sp.]|jgi:hypothetical protein
MKIKIEYWIGIGVLAVINAGLGIAVVGKGDLQLASHISTVVMMLIQIIALLLITAQLSQNKHLHKAEYLSRTMDQLAALRDIPERLQNEETKDMKSSEIVAFLNVYELLSALIDTGVITFEDIDNPFSHRFFLVTHHPLVQEKELFRDAKYYKAIFKLHRNWLEYRASENIKTSSKNSLESFDLYQELSA